MGLWREGIQHFNRIFGNRAQNTESDALLDGSPSPNLMQNAGGISASEHSQEACPEEKLKCTFKKQFFFLADKHN